jgi:biotin transport system substrate-specific component
MVLVSLFTAFTAISAFIQIPVSQIPYTLQDLFVLLAGALLGARLGALSQALYIIIGLIGVPIFTKGGGLSYIFQPTFGFLLGFIVAAFVIGLIVNNKVNIRRTFIASLVGVLVIYVFGVFYLYMLSHLYTHSNISFIEAITIGALPYLPKDIVFCIVAALMIIPLKKGIDNIKKGRIR